MGRNAKPWPRSSDGCWYATINGKQVPLAAKGPENRDAAYAEFHRLKALAAQAVKERDDLHLYLLADMFLRSVKKHYQPSSAERTIGFIQGSTSTKREGQPGFVKFVGRNVPSANVKPADVTRWIDSTDWASNTRSMAAQAVKRMFSWGVEQGYLDASPIAKLKAGQSTPREAVMTREQADAVIAAITSEPLRDFVVALSETGCRPREVRTLAVDRVNLDAGTWQVIDKSRKKTGQECRTVYLSRDMIEMSRRLIAGRQEGYVFRNRNGDRWTKTAIVVAFNRLRKKINKTQKEKEYGHECVAYSYRHLYITDALERGIPPATLAELVGHTDLAMIMRVYNRLRHRTDHLREAAEAARKTPPDGHPGKSSGPKST